MRHLLLALALGCGGLADAAPTSTTDVLLDVAHPLPRHWCCADTLDGKPILECGFEFKPVDATCYCSGIADTEAGTCTQTKDYTPGSFCGQSLLVCW